MRRVIFASLVLVLAVAVHVDWHLARPAHHRLSLAWPHHWLFAAATFAAAGWAIARVWTEGPGRAAAWIVGLALVLGQGVEPMLEVALYQHRFGYAQEAGRWSAFGLCVAAGFPSLLLALWLGRAARDPDSIAAFGQSGR